VPEKTGVLRSFINRTSRIGNQIPILEVLLKSLVFSAERARAASARESYHVRIVGLAISGSPHGSLFCFDLVVRNPPRASSYHQGAKKASRFSQGFELRGKTAAEDQLPAFLEQPIQDGSKVWLRRLAKHNRSPIRVDDHTHSPSQEPALLLQEEPAIGRRRV
jgi:hypothetical protein